MITCYVIGELSTVESLSTYIHDYPHTVLIGCMMQRPESFDTVCSLRPDIVFIDSALIGEEENSLECIRQFSSIVLVSSEKEHAYAAFERFVFDYLISPVTFNRFVKSISKFDHLTKLANSIYEQGRLQEIKSFFIKADSKGSKEVLIRCEQLIYIEALQNSVILHLDGGQHFSCHNSMKEMEESLCGSSFSRIHKSFIINEEKITSVEGNILIMNGNETQRLPIGNKYRKAFFERKARKMIKKQRARVQVVSYSKLGLWLMGFGTMIVELRVFAEIFVLN